MRSWVFVLLLLLKLTFSQPACGPTVASGWTANKFIDRKADVGTPTSSTPGPVGLKWSPIHPNRFYYTLWTPTTHCIVRVDNPDPTTSQSAFTVQQCGYPDLDDLAFDGTGRLYSFGSLVYQIDPDNVTVIRTVASFPNTGSFGAITDPFSGDVFFVVRQSGIYRISSSGPNPTPTLYYPPTGTLSTLGGDGLGIDSTGSLWLGEAGANLDHVWKISGTTSGTPTLLLDIPLPAGTAADGVAISKDNKRLLLNTHPLASDGFTYTNSAVWVTDLTTTPNFTFQTVFTDTCPYRADFMTVGPDGCVYFTHESDAIWRLGPCDFTSSVIDINACIQNPCGSSNATCTDNPLPAPSTSRTCTCNPGFTGDGETCADVNACIQNPCGSSNATCTDKPAPADNTANGRICTCNPGFTGNGETCADINACIQNPCGSSNATCTDKPAPADNTANGRICTCNQGTVGDGDRCFSYPPCQAACQPLSVGTNITLHSETQVALQGRNVTITATISFSSQVQAVPISASNFDITQQGNDRPVHCLSLSSTQTNQEITVTCVTNRLPLGNHKYLARFLGGGCLKAGKSPIVKIKVKHQGGNGNGNEN